MAKIVITIEDSPGDIVDLKSININSLGVQEEATQPFTPAQNTACLILQYVNDNFKVHV